MTYILELKLKIEDVDDHPNPMVRDWLSELGLDRPDKLWPLGIRHIDLEIYPDEPCAAVVHHGPGHQSTTRCELRGAHDIHQAELRGGVARWRGDEATTGFFDEPPEVDE